MQTTVGCNPALQCTIRSYARDDPNANLTTSAGNRIIGHANSEIEEWNCIWATKRDHGSGVLYARFGDSLRRLQKCKISSYGSLLPYLGERTDIEGRYVKWMFRLKLYFLTISSPSTNGVIRWVHWATEIHVILHRKNGSKKGFLRKGCCRYSDYRYFAAAYTAEGVFFGNPKWAL